MSRPSQQEVKTRVCQGPCSHLPGHTPSLTSTSVTQTCHWASHLWKKGTLLHFFVLSERDSRGSCIWKRAGVWVALSKDQEGPDPKNLEEDPGVLTQPVLCRSHIKEVLIPALKHNPLQFCHSEAGEVLRIWLLFSFALTAWSPNCSSGSSLAGSKGHRKVLILEPRTWKHLEARY